VSIGDGFSNFSIIQEREEVIFCKKTWVVYNSKLSLPSAIKKWRKFLVKRSKKF